jgi:8-oxo-dGTP diphosphatase
MLEGTQNLTPLSREKVDMERHFPQIGIGIIIENSEGRILLGKRKGSHGKGYYALPGGKPEYGEDLVPCAIREAKEETGLDIDIIRLVSITNDYMPEYNKHFVTLGFLARTKGSNQQPQLLEPDKCEGWDWYMPDNLPKPMFPYTPKLLKNFRDNTIYSFT